MVFWGAGEAPEGERKDEQYRILNWQVDEIDAIAWVGCGSNDCGSDVCDWPRQKKEFASGAKPVPGEGAQVKGTMGSIVSLITKDVCSETVFFFRRKND